MPSYELDEWLEVQRGLSPQPSPDYLVATFPTEDIRAAYLAVAAGRPEDEIRIILRNFLGSSRSIDVHDQLQLQFLKDRATATASEEELASWSPRFTEYERRVVLRASGKSLLPTWEGITWILDLLPHSPQEAINAIHSYVQAHAQVLPDIRHSGLADAAELIRSRYILQGSESVESLTNLLLALQSREFEYLIAHLYRELGYEVEVTPLQKDRGKDVIARKSGEIVFVECKNWRGRVNSDVVVGLTGRVEIDRATRGVVVGTSGFTSGPASATEVASLSPGRITLSDGAEIIRLLNQNSGSEWHLRVERLISAERLAQDGHQ